MISEVYFTNMTSNNPNDSLLLKLERLYERTGFSFLISENDKVAIKTHFGEIGNTGYIQPQYARKIVDALKKLNSKPFLTDTNTLYHAKRDNSVDHLETATKHGFTYSVINAPVIIADGLTGCSDVEVEINKKLFNKVKIAKDIYDSDAMIVISHVKGHILAGFGGALKNLAMGCASRRGKIHQHKIAAPFISKIACLACNVCIDACPENAITVDTHAYINYEKCIGCNDCIGACPKNAIKLNKINSEEFIESMMEYAYGSVKDKDDKVLYINFLTDIAPDCDCNPYSDRPIVRDIGILASYDPVAIDKASYDLINKELGLIDSALESNHEEGADKFKGVWRNIDGHMQIDFAQQLNMGTKDYKIVEI